MLNQARSIEKWMDLKVARAFSLQVSLDFIIAGASDGIIRVFKADGTMEHLTTLSKPPALLNYNVEKGTTKLVSHTTTNDTAPVYSDCIAISFDHLNSKLAALYSDKTLFIWDFKKLD